MMSKHPLMASLLSAAILTGLTSLTQAETRAAKAHIHGHGIMQLAIEGNKLMIELELPGMDIVGFEHQAASAADKAAVNSAVKTLSDPGRIFALPEAAACTFLRTDVNTGAPHADDHKHAQDEPQHMEFHASYDLTCARPEALSSIDLNLFSDFSSLKEIDVLAITPGGPVSGEATPHNRKIKF